jgi:hypothetical protein
MEEKDQSRESDESREPKPGSPGPETDFGKHGVGSDEEGFVGMDRGIVPDANTNAAQEQTGRDTLRGGSTESSPTAGPGGDAEAELEQGRMAPDQEEREQA